MGVPLPHSTVVLARCTWRFVDTSVRATVQHGSDYLVCNKWSLIYGARLSQRQRYSYYYSYLYCIYNTTVRSARAKCYAKYECRCCQLRCWCAAHLPDPLVQRSVRREPTTSAAAANSESLVQARALQVSVGRPCPWLHGLDYRRVEKAKAGEKVPTSEHADGRGSVPDSQEQLAGAST